MDRELNEKEVVVALLGHLACLACDGPLEIVRPKVNKALRFRPLGNLNLGEKYRDCVRNLNDLAWARCKKESCGIYYWYDDGIIIGAYSKEHIGRYFDGRKQY